MASIRLVQLRKEFKGTVAVDDVSITFPSSAVTCLLGPSGCGKTTVMRMIAGLEEPTSGDVFFGDERMTDLPPRHRKIGMVFQYPVVYHGISVRRNIELPLLHEHIAPAERRKRIDEVVEILRLQDCVDTNVNHLDMATRQKVAVARVIAHQPRFMLFDEPVTNVDVQTKAQIRQALKVLTRQREQTVIYVTHDQTDAMTLADRVVLMNQGRIVQSDAPRALYDRPEEVFAGWFLGNPGMNYLEHALAGANGDRLESPLFPRPLRLSAAGSDRKVTLGIRPEHVGVRRSPTAAAVRARILHRIVVVGGQYLLTVEVGGRTLKVKVPSSLGADLGEETWIECPLQWVSVFGADQRRREVTLVEE